MRLSETVWGNVETSRAMLLQMGSHSQNPTDINLFSGRTGIQMVEETLAIYGTAANAPAWLRPQFNELEAMFGESAAGSGRLSIGDGGSGKHCNNQQVVCVAGVDGQVLTCKATSSRG